MSKVTRLEVIDGTGRALVRHNVSIDVGYQDNGRTLKVFVRERRTATAEAAREEQFHSARLRAGVESCKNMYCPFCGGLVWAPVPYNPFHSPSCPHEL